MVADGKYSVTGMVDATGPSFFTATDTETDSPVTGCSGSMLKPSIDAEIVGVSRFTVISDSVEPDVTLFSKPSSALRV